ncbi:hypothetical protein DYBT9623_02488 [Dyadobacter sp. CECT 9623]|uniref:Uncharacterized protein n=1 Tax=Dyadobacter linearis TaxID=2823330 RepID=A0ABM8UQR2_9BACT|nr:hypothetical protein [Dyadobacter sp. CECT 9623]CAG5069751.1 hypothetical protein DYBT9623_02488 [Dyadobacter sp. CECT 9623]
MEEKKVKFRGMPEMTESEARQYVLDKLRGREIFPEKTARAKAFLIELEKNQQRLIP